MIGFLATVLVVLQMASLSFGLDTSYAMTAGLLACILWIVYAIKKRDVWIIATNVAVGSFAIYGLI